MKRTPFFSLKAILFVFAILLCTSAMIALIETRHHNVDTAFYHLNGEQTLIVQQIQTQVLNPNNRDDLELYALNAEFLDNLNHLSDSKWDISDDIAQIRNLWETYISQAQTIIEADAQGLLSDESKSQLLESGEELEMAIGMVSLEIADHITTHRRQFEPLMLVIMFCAIALFFRGLFIIRADIIKPLILLTERAHDFSTRQYQSMGSAVANDGGEIGHLTAAFDLMQEGFHRTQQDLEALVNLRTRHLSSAFDFTQEIVRQLEVSDIIGNVTNQMKASLDVDLVQVGFIDDSGAQLEITTTDADANTVLALGEADGYQSLLTALTEGEPVINSAHCTACKYQTGKLADGYCAVVPMHLGGHIIGTICAGRESSVAFNDDEVRIMKLFSNSTAIAISNAHLINTLRKRDKLSAINAERERLSVDLHDNLAQNLGVLRLKVANIVERISNQQPSSALQELKQADMLLKESYEQIRSILGNLRISKVVDDGLEQAIKDVAVEFNERMNNSIQLNFPDKPLPAIDQQAQVQLIYILRESLSNIRRHAQSDTVNVKVWEADGFVHLSVVDNGVGFEPDGVDDSKHLGLTIMKTRASRIGGVFTLDSQLGMGTKMLLCVPLSAQVPAPYGASSVS